MFVNTEGKGERARNARNGESVCRANAFGGKSFFDKIGALFLKMRKDFRHFGWKST